MNVDVDNDEIYPSCHIRNIEKIWNSLPDSMRTMTSFKDFKKAIKEMNF